MPFVMSSILGQGNTNLFYMVSSVAFGDFTGCFPNRSKCIFHGVLRESGRDDNCFTCTGGLEFVYGLLLVEDYLTDSIQNLTLLIWPVRANVQRHGDTQRFAFSRAKEFVSVFQQRCEHKAAQCNEPYGLPEAEHALWFVSLRTLKRSKRVPLLT